MSEPPILQIEDLSVSFRTSEGLAPVLRDINLSLHPNDVFGLVGESGSGKSTVLFAIMSYLAANAVVESGRIRYRGTDLLTADRSTLDQIRGRRIAMIFQDPGSALNPSLHVGAQIVEVLRRHLGMTPAEARTRTIALLNQVRLDDPARVFGSYPHQLSGGMRQRAMIAMALSCEPDVLLMDEPTTGLDVIVQAHILKLIEGLRHEIGAAILFVSHDLGAVARIADRIGVLYAGDLMESGPAREVLGRSRNPYTRGLLSAVPRLAVRTAPEGIPGSTARDFGRFDHCVFADRCFLAEGVCRDSRPTLIAVGPGEHRSRCHFADDWARLTQARARPPRRDRKRDEQEAEEPLLRVEHLSVRYRPGGGLFGLGRRPVVRALDDVSLSVRRNQVVAVVGESGSGKSTLARTILRLEGRRDGRIEFQGREIFALPARELVQFRRSIQMVFQNPTSSLNPRKTVFELVARPLRLAGMREPEVRNRVRATVAAVKLGDSFLDRYPHRLSGGEKQRVALARAFATDPVLVILDEPTTALDVSVQAAILDLLHELRERTRCSYLLISHDLAVVRQLADIVVVLQAGKVRESGPAERLLQSPNDTYTRQLIAAVPDLPLDPGSSAASIVSIPP
jgi:peptide/nickel transport system ATP-binding protein